MVDSFSNKKDLADKLLSEAASVFFHLDPRCDGVVVPPQFRRQPGLVLEMGLNMAVDIRDLRVDDDAISGTLSFNRSPFWCSLPWSSVFAMVTSDKQGSIWPQDVPPELRDEYVPEQARRPAVAAVRAVADLPDEGKEADGEETDKVVSDEPVSPEAASVPTKEESEPKEGKKRKLPSYLRVVK